jgi:hypothetical protein
VSLPIPYAVIVFYVGFLLGVLRNLSQLNLDAYIGYLFERESGANVIVFLLLPTLLFNETINLKWYVSFQF